MERPESTTDEPVDPSSPSGWMEPAGVQFNPPTCSVEHPEPPQAPEPGPGNPEE